MYVSYGQSLKIITICGEAFVSNLSADEIQTQTRQRKNERDDSKNKSVKHLF